MVRKCTICGKEFETKRNSITCSPECSKKNKNRLLASYRASVRKQAGEQAKRKKKRKSQIDEKLKRGLYADIQKADTIERYARVIIDNEAS